MYRLYYSIDGEERYLISKADEEELYEYAEERAEELLGGNEVTSIEFIIRDILDELVDSWIVEC